MDKPIDLSDDLLGHVILWAKGWYKAEYEKPFPSVHFDRLNEVVQVYTGMPEDYKVGPKDLLKMLSEIADKLGIKHQDIIESCLRDTDAPSSYHVSLDSKLSVMVLIGAYLGSIMTAKVYNPDGSRKVILPDLNPVIKQRHGLRAYPHDMRGS